MEKRRDDPAIVEHSQAEPDQLGDRELKLAPQLVGDTVGVPPHGVEARADRGRPIAKQLVRHVDRHSHAERQRRFRMGPRVQASAATGACVCDSKVRLAVLRLARVWLGDE